MNRAVFRKPAQRRIAAVCVSVMVALAGLAAKAKPAAAQSLTRGPYLQSGSSTNITVRWRTSSTAIGRVDYGTVPGITEGSALGPVTKEHEVQLTGLLPGTRYYYSVLADTTVLTGGDSLHSFVTAPPAGSSETVRMWIIGDSGYANAEAEAVRDAYYGYAGTVSTDVMLMLGDNAYNSGTDSEYQAAVFDMYSDLLRSTVLWPTRGNHDKVRGGANNDYFEFFTLPEGDAGGTCAPTEAYYSFDWANVHFVCLDSEGSDKNPGGCMLTWLEADLAATTQTWIIAFWHHSPYTQGSASPDEEMREKVLPVLEAGGVDLVLTGHSHVYERSMLLDEHYGTPGTLVDSMKIDSGDGRVTGDGAYIKPTSGPAPHEGAVYAVVGSSASALGGPLNHPSMIASLNELGSLVVDVDALRLDGRFLNSAGAFRDSFTIVKNTGTVSVPLAAATTDRARILPGRPNPFFDRTSLAFAMPAAGLASVTVLDVSGRLIRTLANGHHAAGRHPLTWDGRDEGGSALPAGIYFAVLEAGGTISASKIVLVR